VHVSHDIGGGGVRNKIEGTAEEKAKSQDESKKKEEKGAIPLGKRANGDERNTEALHLSKRKRCKGSRQKRRNRSRRKKRQPMQQSAPRGEEREKRNVEDESKGERARKKSRVNIFWDCQGDLKKR